VRVTAAKVRRQARFARETARGIAREPGLARDFPRFLATLRQGPTRLRMPWLPFRLADELETVVRLDSRVFEYGGGGSTLWFLDRGAIVVTVEHDQAWAAVLECAVESDSWTLLRPSIGDGYARYAGAICSFPDDWFDVVLVDGRARRRCVVRSLPKVKPGGLLLVDDVDRERHARAVRGVPWPRRDVVGFAPSKLSLGHTAVLTRPRT
jgi:Methyltransferase domain